MALRKVIKNPISVEAGTASYGREHDLGHDLGAGQQLGRISWFGRFTWGLGTERVVRAGEEETERGGPVSPMHRRVVTVLYIGQMMSPGGSVTFADSIEVFLRGANYSFSRPIGLGVVRGDASVFDARLFHDCFKVHVSELRSIIALNNERFATLGRESLESRRD